MRQNKTRSHVRFQEQIESAERLAKGEQEGYRQAIDKKQIRPTYDEAEHREKTKFLSSPQPWVAWFWEGSLYAAAQGHSFGWQMTDGQLGSSGIMPW